jgi:hypothetical protein
MDIHYASVDRGVNAGSCRWDGRSATGDFSGGSTGFSLKTLCDASV